MVNAWIIGMRLAVGKGIGETSHQSDPLRIVIMKCCDAQTIFATSPPGDV
jgi:hypothetical protein